MIAAMQNHDDMLVRYLLGDPLPAEETERLEERYFADDSEFDHVCEVEDELIEAYLRGRLTAKQRSSFESHFLASARRREKLEAQEAILWFFRSQARSISFFASLRRLLSAQTRLMKTALAASAAVLVAGGCAAIVGVVRMQTEITTLRAMSKQAAEPGIATFLLSPGVLRSGTGRQLQVETGADWVRFELNLGSGGQSYAPFTASLSNADGAELWRQSSLRSRRGASGYIVEAIVPAAVLAPGDYVLALWGAGGQRGREPLPSYVFRVVQP